MAWGGSKTGRTEHAGAKNGGGWWGTREWAKRASNTIRRQRDRTLEATEAQQREREQEER